MRLRILPMAVGVVAMCAFGVGSVRAGDPAMPAGVAGGPQVKEQNGMAYVSGGVGSDEAQMLEHMGQFNLKVTFATQQGKFLGGGPVKIENTKGQTLLDATSEGPMFLAKVPPGEYKISATANGKPMAQTVHVSGEEQAQVAFVWPDGPGDRSIAGDAPEAQ